MFAQSGVCVCTCLSVFARVHLCLHVCVYKHAYVVICEDMEYIIIIEFCLF